MVDLYKTDHLNLILYCLYRLSDDKRYENISRLSYALDEKNFVKFISMFSGQEIAVPTIEEVRSVTSALQLYVYLNIDQKGDLQSIIKSLSLSSSKSVKELLELYLKINSFISNYSLPGEQLKNLKQYLELFSKELESVEKGWGLKQSIAERLERVNKKYQEELDNKINGVNKSELIKTKRSKEC